MSKPSIGPISEGTLRNEDLIPCFFDELEGINANRALDIAEKYTEIFKTEEDENSITDFWIYDNYEWGSNEEAEAALVIELQEALDDESPPYCYFGAQEGDGACFGFWPMDPREIIDFNSEVIKANAGDEPEYILSVNDHGNVTLYKVNLEEVWSVV